MSTTIIFRNTAAGETTWGGREKWGDDFFQI